VVGLVVEVVALGSMVGIFDSGSGGLSVLRAIRTRAPHADVVYFGDLKNVPYGNKTREELDTLTAHGIHVLHRYGAEQLVSACNSIALSTRTLCRECFISPYEVIEMVGPTASLLSSPSTHALVLATKATIESGIYQEQFLRLGSRADGVALPELVPLIEAQREVGRMEDMVRTALAQSLTEGHTHLILGCTHFPLVREVFLRVLGEFTKTVEIVDPAESVAEAVAEQFDTQGTGKTRILVSAKSPVFESFFKTLFPKEECAIEVI